MKSRSVAVKPEAPESRQATGLSRVSALFLSLPRGIRLLLVALVSFSFAALMMPAIDTVYLQYFYSESTRVLPSLLSAAAGIIVYVLGWWLMVGTVNESPPRRPAVLGFVGFGMICLLLTVVLLAYGFFLGMAPT